MRTLALVSTIAALSPAASCAPPIEPAGSVEVVVETSGLDPDAAYVIRIDGELRLGIGSGPTFVLPARPGAHDITVAEVASNCAVTGGPSRGVTVPSGGRVTTTFEVICVARTGAIEVSANMLGNELDLDGFFVWGDRIPSQPLGLGARVVFEAVPGGDHQVSIGGVALNCGVNENPLAATVRTGGMTRDTARLTFDVVCASMVGSVRVTTRTTGVDLDPDGYVLAIDTEPYLPVPVNGTVILPQVIRGVRQFDLMEVAENCGGTLRHRIVVIPSGTVDVTFEVVCAAKAD